MDRTVEAAGLAGSQVAHDLSVISLFLNADLIVKAVILLLILASFWSWAIIFEKMLRLRRLHRQADEFEDSFWSGGSLEDLYDRLGNQPLDPMSAMFGAAMREWRRSASKGMAVVGQIRAGQPGPPAGPEGRGGLPTSTADRLRPMQRRVQPRPPLTRFPSDTSPGTPVH